MAISALVPRGDRDLAELFGSETGDELDKFTRADWHEPGPTESRCWTGCPHRFAGRSVERYVDLGDHVGMVLEPFFAEADEEAASSASIAPSASSPVTRT